MKRNLNSLKRLISKFHRDKNLSKEDRFYLLDEILFFANRMERKKLINEKTKNIELHEVRASEIKVATRTYKIGTTFMRARKIDAILENPKLQDFWEPPSGSLKKSRLNQAGEAVLYVTCDTLTAKKETHIKKDDIYNLNLYRAESPIKVTEFGFPITGKRAIIEKTIEEFFNSILIMRGENIYDLSNFIAKRYFELSEDGWVYPSVANNHYGDNICLKIKSKTKLSLIGAFAFCNDIPIASYDLTNSHSIKPSSSEEASRLWGEFTSDPQIFGKILATPDPRPLHMVKQIHELDF